MRDELPSLGARVCHLPVSGLVTIRGALADTEFATALASCGVGVPQPRRIDPCDMGQVAWMSPDELLVMCPPDAASDLVARLSAALDGQHYLAVEVSSARARFSISGPRARVTLAKLCPVDMAHLPQGEIRRTRLAQVAAALWLTRPDVVELICFQSVAEYAHTALLTAAAHGDDIVLP